MREIKFRAWDKVYQCMIYDVEHYSINDLDHSLELMQYTNLKDSNGTEIYDSDILQIVETGKETLPREKPFVVKWDINCWNVPRMSHLYTVIGNIYEQGE
jgi:uncharacterized phage protein (TIGR01671 family)